MILPSHPRLSPNAGEETPVSAERMLQTCAAFQIGQMLTEPQEYPLVANGRNFTYRGFDILAMQNSGGTYWTFAPSDEVEGAAWSMVSDEPADTKTLAQAMDAIDAWRDAKAGAE